MLKLSQKSEKYYFYLRSAQSPTFFNLARYLLEKGWHSTKLKWRANFNEENLQFNPRAAQQLEFKHLLAQLVQQYCPEVMPLTYCINDNNWPLILNKIANQYYIQDSHVIDVVQNLVWILKPALLNNGQGIKIFQRLSQVESHYLSSKRLGGEHVLQRYLIEPHLLRGHKYSIRMFVVFTNFAGVYLYPSGYFNVGLTAYSAQDFNDLSPHLTNEHLIEPQVNVVQIPTQKFEWFPQFYPEIKNSTCKVISSLRQMYPHAFVCTKTPQLAIFGFDFMFDVNMHLWLLETNHGACFPISDEHPLQKYLYYDFWQAFITSFVIPIASRKIDSTVLLFDPL